MEETKGDYIEQYLKHHYRLFPVNGKMPKVKEWQKIKEDPFLSPTDFPDNFGVTLQPDDLVIDVDVWDYKNNKPKVGKESFYKLLDDVKIKYEDTFGVKTGSGGFHFYFKKPKDVPVREMWGQYPDLEFKSAGRYVIGAGSIHPNTNKIYKKVTGTMDKILPAPDALLDLIKKKPVDFSKIGGLSQYMDDLQSINRCKKFLLNAEPAVQGAGGDQATYIIACRCRGYGLSPQIALDLMCEYWNPKCVPEWDAGELKNKVYNAYMYDVSPLGVSHPENDFKDVEKQDRVYWMEEELRKDGTRKPGLVNTVAYLVVDEQCNGLLKFNQFSSEIEFTRRPVWYPPSKKLVPWSADDDAPLCRYHLGKYQKFEVNSNMMMTEAAYIKANDNSYHPIRDYLTDLKWDGVERASSWLTRYAHVKSNKYVQTVGLNTLLAAVARVYEPGTKFDNVLILEGCQGVGKSRLLKALGKDWFADIHIDPNDKDTVDVMRNKWIIEVSEMTMVKQTDIDALKRFLSCSTDRARLAYRKNAVDYPRQCIFIGTINPDKAGYLKDTTGNRRFWPVAVPRGKKIKVKLMEKEVDQLWAEVVHIYKSGMQNIHIADGEIEKLAAAEAAKRQVADPWIEPVKEWLGKETEEGFIMHVKGIDIYCHALNGIATRYNRPEQTRVTALMIDELGWKKGSYRCKTTGRTIAGFNRPKNDIGLL